jgi:hypothetical protein
MQNTSYNSTVCIAKLSFVGVFCQKLCKIQVIIVLYVTRSFTGTFCQKSVRGLQRDVVYLR